MGGGSGSAMQLVAFFTLVTVQSGAILLFKLAQIGGGYSFSPASSVCLTEMVKFTIAFGSHALEVRRTGDDWFPDLSWPIIGHYFGLSILYTINNILTFYVLEEADPGTLSLFKSIAPYLCAMLLRLTGQKLNRLQWSCVVIQCCAIAIIQYDVTKGVPLLKPVAYVMLTMATSITAVSSVWNQLVLKGFSVPLNLQNAILYTFGMLTSIICFWVGPSKSIKGFFEGYNMLGVALILFQALHGLAVSFVYKHADAIIKNFANSSVMAVLVCVSAFFFGLQMNVHSALAVVIIVVTTYIYMSIAIHMKEPAHEEYETRENVGLVGSIDATSEDENSYDLRPTKGMQSGR
ncbi:nucleotide-sugar transporter-domain-containing protein [Pavlovales sp. CCMP2436]|nr:nucleotide-sugar transporter-domain-containing protein [Pavlovales sp. CCMP2436]|mmetsp:Transcript_43081/g.106318  ORF Transcript_43081/g.106318 Transcript_43081/m.106318 type:complete len:348 (-) Transcript_43081:446-1489(-)